MPARSSAPIVAGMTADNDLLILIPSAGASRRMGRRDKCLEMIAGEPALRRAARLALSVSAHVRVSLPADGPRLAGRQQALAGLAVGVLSVPDAGEGMAASLRAGARAALTQSVSGMMILLPDMPEIDEDDIRGLAETFARSPNRPLRAASADGVAGHPVILPKDLLGALALLSGDRGARDILLQHPATLHPLAGNRATLDLDTVEDWDRWRTSIG